MVVRPAPSGQSEFDTAHLGNHLGPPMGPRQTTAIVIEQSGSEVEQAKPGAEADPVRALFGPDHRPLPLVGQARMRFASTAYRTIGNRWRQLAPAANLPAGTGDSKGE